MQLKSSRFDATPENNPIPLQCQTPCPSSASAIPWSIWKSHDIVEKKVIDSTIPQPQQHELFVVSILFQGPAGEGNVL